MLWATSADDQLHQQRTGEGLDTLILPPESGVPPMTTAAIALSSMSRPRVCGSLAEIWRPRAPGDRGEVLRDDVHVRQDAFDPDPGELGGERIPTDGFERASNVVCLDDEHHRDQQERGDQHGVRNAQERSARRGRPDRDRRGSCIGRR